MPKPRFFVPFQFINSSALPITTTNGLATRNSLGDRYLGKTSSHPQATTTSFYKSRRHSHAGGFLKPLLTLN